MDGVTINDDVVRVGPKSVSLGRCDLYCIASGLCLFVVGSTGSCWVAIEIPSFSNHSCSLAFGPVFCHTFAFVVTEKFHIFIVDSSVNQSIF